MPETSGPRRSPRSPPGRHPRGRRGRSRPEPQPPEAAAARSRGQQEQASRQQALAASYQAMHHAYCERETIFAAVMADRADWEQATRKQWQLAVAAHAELRRRHPDQRFAPLRSAEPPPATQAQRDELTLTAGEEISEMGQWIKDLAAQHRAFADKLAERQSLMIPPKTLTIKTSAPPSPPGLAPARTRSCSRPSHRPSHQRGYLNAGRGRSQRALPSRAVAMTPSRLGARVTDAVPPVRRQPGCPVSQLTR